MDGTHTGEAMGIPPSNQEVRVRGMELWRVANGKIAEHWGVVDISDVLQKAGVMPS
jgi:predicted ester cyclase